MRQPSRQQIVALVLCSVVCLISAVPLPQPAGNQELDVLQIPLANGKEIDVLTLGAKDQETLIADRNKRTIGLLRELFPDITKEINVQINRLVNNVLQRVGPVVLGTVLNPAFDRGLHSRQPAKDDVDDDEDKGSKDYDQLPEDLTQFQPDSEFAKERGK
ncbi:uncharacterized protein LOC128265267 isoform X6 [Drosophila gunungcola]|uniref:Uncharacterized protein n=1 Tax=Drosophila gunungcola TaxID=103775 RepID=A0A9P9YB45_9MUSC|nr:uncharacterized protein LOC128265267 isoform X6 [Drosophila gunungcola]KAI8033729.1 hypothetical protein M5D96_013512 [Drosophila gunungcola]